MPSSEIVITESANEAHHELIVDGHSVSGLWVVYRSMRIGAAVVRMGGIAGVGTAEEHRNKGYSRRVLENCNLWMRDQGFDCAILFGIPDYYHRFGYAPCLIDCEMTLRTRQAERAVPHLKARPFTAGDRAALAPIYAAQNARITGTLERSPDGAWFAHGTRWNLSTEPWVFCDLAGNVRAYAARDAWDESVTVCDLGAIAPADFADILRWAADRAIALRCGEVRFHLPPGHPFADYATDYGARVTQTYHHTSDGMGRILNLVPFLRALAPELTIRARAAGIGTASARLETDIGVATLTWDGSEVRAEDDVPAAATLRLPQHRLMQLAMGYHSVEIALALPGVSAEGDIDLLRALFPREPGYMWLPDHF